MGAGTRYMINPLTQRSIIIGGCTWDKLVKGGHIDRDAAGLNQKKAPQERAVPVIVQPGEESDLEESDEHKEGMSASFCATGEQDDLEEKMTAFNVDDVEPPVDIHIKRSAPIPIPDKEMRKPPTKSAGRPRRRAPSPEPVESDDEYW